FSYLAFPRLVELPPHVQLECVPVLLAGLLKHFGQAGPAEIPSKRRFTYRFVIWRARSMGIPMRMPPAHPFNPLSALRLIIAAGAGDRRGALLGPRRRRHGARVFEPSRGLRGSRDARRGRSACRRDTRAVKSAPPAAGRKP